MRRTRGRVPRPAGGGWRTTFRGIAAIAVVAAVASLGHLMFLHFDRVVRLAPSARATAQHPRRAMLSAGSAPSTNAPGVAQFPALTGVGCPPRQRTSAITGARSQGGDGWIRVHGGLPDCRGQAIATRKTGTVGLVQDTFTWTFHVGHPAICTAQIFIADINTSSGSAQYDVYGNSLAPDARIGHFEINQRAANGQWVREGSWQVESTLSVQLTDAPAYPGDVYHVTASAAKANCG